MTDKITDAVEQCINNYSATLNNFPPDAQRQISRYYDFDNHHIKILKKLEMFTAKTKKFTSADGQHMKQMLIETLDLADRKVEISDRIMHLVEDNMFKLNMSFKAIEMANPSKKLCKNPKRLLKWVPNYTEIDSDSIDDVLIVDDSNEHSMMKTKTIKTSKKKFQLKEKVNNKFQTSKTIFTDTNSNTKSKIKDKNPSKQISKGVKIEEFSDNDSDVEPTYCICEDISYGNMVCCDNDLCPIEWFHFKCVSVRRKPKGKWYCPRCRGTSSKVMKPRQVFFKELEEYNKRKEEGL